MAWYTKKMLLNEWASFQGRYEALYIAAGAPADEAVLISNDFGAPDADIFVAGGIIVFQALSPGDWREVQKPEGPRLGFLIGHADFCERHGINLGA